MRHMMLCYKATLIRALSATGIFCVLAFGIVQCGVRASSDGDEPSRPAAATPLAIAALPNAFRLHAKVISGGQPEGEAGFRALQELGVRTVISVDGAKPELALAKKYGLRYVHLPHGYDGIPEQRVLELAKAVSELPGPIYVHCHHGKHRSPAAAAVACITAGLMTREAGQELLQVAGTGKNYQGLYQAVATAEQRAEVKDLRLEFNESADVPPIATAMVRIERTLDNLKQIENAQWQPPAAHPDLTPAHEALLLREQFTELLRTDEVRGRPLAFRELLERTRAAAESLETQLRDESAARPVTSAARRLLSASLASINNDCVQCHRAHRD
jgi:protein tyrosine phosphatase (PTP) superfamily phosphohydrolase (DUF442 family)